MFKLWFIGMVIAFLILIINNKDFKIHNVSIFIFSLFWPILAVLYITYLINKTVIEDKNS